MDTEGPVYVPSELQVKRRPATLSARAPIVNEDKEKEKMNIFREYAQLNKKSCEIAAMNPIDPSATHPFNNHKNRYTDVLPTAETAVKLEPLEGKEGSTYINANFVVDEKNRQSYVCCQAPLASTMGDFWRMIWQHDISTIVMITKLRERDRTKADKYWPTNIGDKSYYEKIAVKFVKEFTKPGSSLTIRTFYIYQVENGSGPSSPGCHTPPAEDSYQSSKDSGEVDPKSEGTCSGDADEDVPTYSSSSEDVEVLGPNMRKITQLHCTEWPDQGIPKSTDSMKELLQEFDLRKGLVVPGKPLRPICVHCSAGIGRTGTFVAIHIGLELWLAGERYNIFDIVKNLRAQRQGMVQTKEQYYFIHRAIEDIISSKSLFRDRSLDTDLRTLTFRRASSANELMEPKKKLPNRRQTLVLVITTQDTHHIHFTA